MIVKIFTGFLTERLINAKQWATVYNSVDQWVRRFNGRFAQRIWRAPAKDRRCVARMARLPRAPSGLQTLNAGRIRQTVSRCRFGWKVPENQRFGVLGYA